MPPAVYKLRQYYRPSAIDWLAETEAFKQFKDAFQKATTLPLRLCKLQDESDPNGDKQTQSPTDAPLCDVLRGAFERCGECSGSISKYSTLTACEKSFTFYCPANVCNTAIPIRAGSTILGFLITGKIFKTLPSEKDFENLHAKLSKIFNNKSSKENLRKAYFAMPHVQEDRYEGIISLLIQYADRFSDMISEYNNAGAGAEPSAITKAKNYINENLGGNITLGQVAKKVGLSDSHFCRFFRDAIGVTFTEYTNRCRIEWAKRELLNPNLRISEAAFLVGYQSLSQFNRSFAKIVGKSPTAYRRAKLMHKV